MIDISLEGFVTFTSFGLPAPILKGIRAAGLTEPTAIQTKTIPIVMHGNDLIGIAQAGSGKSGAYLIPTLGRLAERSSRLRAIVLVPTRELASYVETRARDYARFTEIAIGVVYTGAPISAQERALRERPTNLLVATPGRLLELHARGCLDFADVEILVLDEADRMVALGLAPDLRRLLKLLPETRQTLMFTLTMPPELNRLAKEALVEPVRVDVGSPARTSTGITQAVYPVSKELKPDLLDDMLARSEVRNTIVLTRARTSSERLARQLARRGYAVTLLDEHPSQGDRDQALEDLRRGRVQILVASETSSRSLDMAGTAHVVNYDVPQTPEDYVHRLGRTGRGDPVGDAFTLMSPDEQKYVDAIEQFLGRAIPRVMLPDFDYSMSPGTRRPAALDEEVIPRRAVATLDDERGGGTATATLPATKPTRPKAHPAKNGKTAHAANGRQAPRPASRVAKRPAVKRAVGRPSARAR
jgi:ATP-dependent RNA helicase RhlE